MYKIYLDVEFSRRKRLHHILNEHDEVVWSGPKIGDVFAYLIDQTTEPVTVYADDPKREFLLTVHEV